MKKIIFTVLLSLCIFQNAANAQNCLRIERIEKDHGYVRIPTFTIEINKQKTLDELKKESNCVHIMKQINNDNFPIKNANNVEKITVSLFSFDEGHIETKEVLRKLDSLGYRPLTITEILVFSAQHSDFLQSDCEIIALGSVWIVPDSMLNFNYKKSYVPTLFAGGVVGYDVGTFVEIIEYDLNFKYDLKFNDNTLFFAATKKS